jgi:hypothetical protein
MPDDGYQLKHYVDEGSAARLKDEPKPSNPYIVGSSECQAWDSGWMVVDQELRPEEIAPGPKI